MTSIVSLYGLAQQSLREDISLEEMEANWDNFNTLDENEPEDAPIENIEEISEETPESEEDIVPSQGVSTKEMTYQNVYKIVDVTDTPMDAYGIALQYIGSGGKIDEDSLYKEVITRRDERLTPKKQTKEESRNRDYVSKNVKSIGKVAEDIWESLDEDIQDKLSDQDIKNALLDVVGSFNTRLEAAKEFVSKYSTQDDVDRAMKAPIKTPIEIAISAAKKAQVKKIVINGQAYTEKGNKLYKNDVEVINKRVNEIYAVRKEIQNQTIRVTTYGNKNYFVLSDDSIVASDKATLGQKVNVSEDVKEMILDKAIEYRKTC